MRTPRGRYVPVRLLEDGTEDPNNPLGDYNFGSSPELLFNACPEDEEEMEGAEYGGQCFFFPDGRSYAYDPLLRLRLVPSEEEIKNLKHIDSYSPLEGHDVPLQEEFVPEELEGSGI